MLLFFFLVFFITFTLNLFQPQNIVLMGQFPNCEIKLCDLEVARVIKEDEEITEIIGTPDYVGKVFLKIFLDLIQRKNESLFHAHIKDQELANTKNLCSENIWLLE